MRLLFLSSCFLRSSEASFRLLLSAIDGRYQAPLVIGMHIGSNHMVPAWAPRPRLPTSFRFNWSGGSLSGYSGGVSHFTRKHLVDEHHCVDSLPMYSLFFFPDWAMFVISHVLCWGYHVHIEWLSWMWTNVNECKLNCRNHPIYKIQQTPQSTPFKRWSHQADLSSANLPDHCVISLSGHAYTSHLLLHVQNMDLGFLRGAWLSSKVTFMHIPLFSLLNVCTSIPAWVQYPCLLVGLPWLPNLVKYSRTGNTTSSGVERDKCNLE